MDIIIDAAAASAATVVAVNLVKFGWPTAPAWALALISVLAGIGLSLLTIPAGGGVWNDQSAAVGVFQGLFAAAAAAGIDRQAVAAEAERRAAG